MGYNFDVRYDSVSTLALPGYTDREKSLFLTLAQERLVKSYYNIEGNKYRKGFESTEKRRKDLAKLVRPSTDSAGYSKSQPATFSVGKIDKNSKFFTLPEDFWLAITEWGYTEEGTARPPQGVGVRYDIKPITHDEFNAQRKNPFQKPSSCGKAWRLDITSNTGVLVHEIIGDKPIVQYHVRYLKKLRNIEVSTLEPTLQVDCELEDMFHREIVEIAVELALETISDTRFQTMKIGNLNIE